MSTSTDDLVTLDSPGERRFYPRIAPSRPIYIPFGGNNLGMLLNLGENGLLVSTPSGLDLNSVFRVSLRLHGLAKPIEVHVRTVWSTESTKRAGIQLLDLSEHDREQVRKWGALELSRQKNAEPQPLQENSQPQHEKPASQPFPAEPAQQPERPFAPALLVAPPALAPFDAATHLDFPWPQDLAAPRRSRKKSAAPALIAWSVLAVICLAAALFLDPGLSERFLKRMDASAMQSAAPSDTPAPPPSALDTQVQADATPALSNIPSPKTASPRSVVPAASPTNFPSETSLAKYADAKPSLPKTDAPAATNADFTGSDSAQFAANEAPNALPTAITAAPTLAPTNNQPLAPAPPTRSAVAGSIASPAAPTNDSATATATTPLPANAVSPTTARQAWTTSGPPISAGRTSFFHPRSSSAVVQMDPAPRPVTEITAPRSLTASYVALSGERVLDSPTVTMHIQRSVLVPGDHWLWNTHKKVALGELTSRVDPQISRLPTTSGTITVQATIDKDGRVTNLKPLNGSFAFLPSVSKAIREWRYEPTYLDNKPVETQAQIELNFHPPTRR